MKLFIDTGSVAEVEEIAAWGVLAGATTNPSLLAKEDGDPGEIVTRICDLVGGPVSAEVVAEGPTAWSPRAGLSPTLHQHVVVKVPFCAAGLAATRQLSDEGIRVNMTLVFSPGQALLTAEAGATYVSCFMGRLDDISVDSAEVLREVVAALRAGESEAQVLAASIRNPARRHRGAARLRGRDGAGEGASADARPSADDGRDRAFCEGLARAPGIWRVAGEPRGQAAGRSSRLSAPNR